MRLLAIIPLWFLLSVFWSVAQEAVLPDAGNIGSELRSWEAVNGNKVEAEFVSITDGEVRLRLKTGKIFKVPHEKLSEKDRQFIEARLPFKEKLKIGFVTNASAPFWLYAKAGITRAESEFEDIQVEFKVGDGTVAKQLALVEDLLARGVKGIAISPLNPEGQREKLNQWAAKAPLITVDTDIVNSKRRLFLGPDNVASGRQAGELLKEALPDGGKVMAFVGFDNQANAIERYQGIQEAVAGTKIELLGMQADQLDFRRARENAVIALAEHPDLAGMVGIWSYNGPLILEAVKAKGVAGKVKIVAFDDDPRTLKAIDAGDIHATVVQQPYEYGYQSVKFLRAMIIEGKPLEEIGIDESNKKLIKGKVIRKAESSAYLKKLQGWSSSP